MSKSSSAAEKADKTKSSKLDKTKQSEIKEKTYNTKQVETSIAILESPENDVVLEASLFLSKYVDINKNNISYLIRNGIVPKLVKNFNKNICILRLSLRLLSNLLDKEETLYEIDQEQYDEKLLDIARMFIEHKDAHVKEFCIEILAKVASSCRIMVLIFKIDLFNPIFDIMKTSKNSTMLYHTLLFFYRLMYIPPAVCDLPECKNFDTGTLLMHLRHNDGKIATLVFDIVEKLTKYNLPFLQENFKKSCLVEKMLSIIMDEALSHHHDIVIKIIHNCLRSEETEFYFVESVEFLDFCQWVKTCHPKYLLPMIEVFIKITSIPEIKQVLFDLSVEESILYFFRYINKAVINKTCQAVSNMTTHKYCCEHMLTPTVAEVLLEILNRPNDEEDPYNEVALTTVFHFTRRNFKALGIFMEKGFKPILLNYFHVKSKLITEESFLMILEILYRYMSHPAYQSEFISKEILLELLRLFRSSSVEVSTMCCEMLTNVSHLEEFRTTFLASSGAQIFMEVLNSVENIELLTQILFFIFSCLVYEGMAMAFLHKGLIMTLRKLSDYVISKIPLAKRVLHLALGYYPPLKFYETGRLEVIDVLPNKFYVINGQWPGTFPFLEILEGMYVSPYETIYLVDYSYEITKDDAYNAQSDTSLKCSEATLNSSSYSITSSKNSRGMSITSFPSAFDINYGRISKDPFLPRYIYHIKKYEGFLKGSVPNRASFLAEYVDTLLCGPRENLTLPQKIHEYKLHIECLKNKLGNNIIPIGYLRLGFHCERALLFKTLADALDIPCSLVRGNLKIYWNEVAVFEGPVGCQKVAFYIVDLINNVGDLIPVGSREANKYCKIN